MGIWIFNLIVSLVIPAILIIYCKIYRDKAPEDINGSNGYKTTMSRLNRDTWEFANHYFTGLMRVAGWILLVISPVAMLAVLGKGKDIVNFSGLILIGVQLAVILVSIIPTEKALHKTFDENGYRK